MFSSKARLQKRTPENGIDREQFIGLLSEEYYTTTLVGESFSYNLQRNAFVASP